MRSRSVLAVMCVGHVGTLMSCLAAAGTIIAVSSAVLPDLGGQVVQEGARRSDGAPKMHPYYLGGLPDNEQVHVYSDTLPTAPHTAAGDGLFHTATGTSTSFVIRLAGEEDEIQQGKWNLDARRFIYVWIASEDHIFHAEVVNNGNGTLTATYESDFPGSYLVYIEDVTAASHARNQPEGYNSGVPIVGSPFALTITGDPTLDIGSLPVCGQEERDVEASFWREGSWISANVASVAHGVTRTGWIFQPRTCVHDAFTLDDIMMLAALEEPTWIVILGNSVMRGVAQSLFDMALAQGQKANLKSSSLGKCWGYAQIQIGNLRITYQDMRLFPITSSEDSVICNDEKLKSGSTSAYLTSSKHFLQKTLFGDGGVQPSVIVALANLDARGTAPNFSIEVVMNSLPKSWSGKVLMLEHMAGLAFSLVLPYPNNVKRWSRDANRPSTLKKSIIERKARLAIKTFHWETPNPTRKKFEDVHMAYHSKAFPANQFLARVDRYEKQDPRTTFQSIFPMYQARLFENEFSRDGKREYGSSTHLHYVHQPEEEGSYGGSRMVVSAITEMLANIVIGQAVGTKEALYGRAASTMDIGQRSAEARASFQICADCPPSLIPFHVKATPHLKCQNVTSLTGHAPVGETWDKEVCPDWCLATEPTGETMTGSGPVKVRVCESDD